ncbi:hypothetical protein HBA55_07385 [Pseudomaricurvus alkylphenolicus]|jgi:uroporphyrin-3 C-methyltransferase|uniref:uroporphyrinogen-III C-methyltransferase n=1 Tax=Pseudomaricurvus alkylphenolicus TaxID=1306991 RepID=UPI00141F19D7|nr:uroporphyrinogen-III C-methyltransferase [Pseudomaricurvus alkylphenolicus]NIB39402.1 hypothetical protein [Pseudomaricurvus alkylphenolicus]
MSEERNSDEQVEDVSGVAVADIAEPIKDSEASEPKQDKTATSRAPLWLVALVVVMLLAMTGTGYLGWNWLQQQTQQQQAWRSSLQQQQQQLTQARSQLQEVAQQQRSQVQDWQNGLQGLDQRLQQHSRRLRSLATTSREDWLLAEAEYLLRLASQRLLMERGPSGALALLQAADKILVEMDDDELFPVRDKLARDIAALKLAPAIDRSGLYLQIDALSEQIMQLPQTPRYQRPLQESVSDAAAPAPEGFWPNLKSHFFSAMDRFASQVQYRRHDKPLPPLLPPDGGSYLRQNLRFKLEQAQLALLREESSIYRHSLEQAVSTLRQFFPMQSRAQTIANELQQLSGQAVRTDLPSLGGSLSALQEYIERLHLLDATAGQPQLREEPGTDEGGQ